MDKQSNYSSEFKPRLVCTVNFYKKQIIFSQDSREFGFQVDDRSCKKLEKLE